MHSRSTSPPSCVLHSFCSGLHLLMIILIILFLCPQNCHLLFTCSLLDFFQEVFFTAIFYAATRRHSVSSFSFAFCNQAQSCWYATLSSLLREVSLQLYLWFFSKFLFSIFCCFPIFFLFWLCCYWLLLLILNKEIVYSWGPVIHAATQSSMLFRFSLYFLTHINLWYLPTW